MNLTYDMTVINKIKNKRFIRNVMLVVAGSAGAQALNLLLTPLLTRLYSPSELGLLSAYISYVLAIGPIFSFTMQTAIVLPRNKVRARELGKISFLLSIFTLLLTCIIFFIFNFFSLVSDFIKEYFIYIVLSAFFYSTYQIFTQTIIREEKFKFLAKMTFLFSLCNNLGKVLLGFLIPSGIFLVPFNSSLYLLFCIFSLFYIYKCFYWNSYTYLKLVALKYRDFAFYRTPEVILNSASQVLPIFALTTFFTLADVGHYGLARAILGVPVILIGKSICDVLYPKIAKEIHNSNKAYKLLKDASLYLAVIGLIPCVIVFVFGSEIFELLFGEEWAFAGEIGSWVSVWMFSALIMKPSVTAIPALGKQKSYMFYSLYSLILKCIAVSLSITFQGNVIEVIKIFCLVCTLSNIILVHRVLKFLSGKRSKV